MKKILGSVVISVLMLQIVFAYSCPKLIPSHETLTLDISESEMFNLNYAKSDIVFIGTLEKKELPEPVLNAAGNPITVAYLGGQIKSTHILTFDVDETVKGSVGSNITLTYNSNTSGSCSRPMGCPELVEGSEYVVLTDGQTISRTNTHCPFILASEFDIYEASSINCTDYSPVCSALGQTYDNMCSAYSQGSVIGYQGECRGLSSSQVNYIESIVNKRLETASDEDIARIIGVLAEKRQLLNQAIYDGGLTLSENELKRNHFKRDVLLTIGRAL